MPKKIIKYLEFGKGLYGENGTVLTGVNGFGQHFLHF
jgi:hypothetical protein